MQKEKVGVEGLDRSSETSCFAALFNMGEADYEAIAQEATLRELVRL